ncbi:MAG: T9SS type A sorting domain-containing protein [Fibrobacteres bacterium]|nr:T9SS type A sorting domain-containing protein [Fibrobacterota bacterium]
MRYKFSVLFLFAVLTSVIAVPSFVRKPVFEKNGSSWNITFEINEPSDVEVAIIDTVTKSIIRHLAAGRIGIAKTPSPLSASTLSQTLIWDGKDDYRQLVVNTANLNVRVRVGMTTKIDRIVGGDPYAFFSKEMVGGDHHIWAVAGLDAKPDGSVYMYGTNNQMGVYTVRKYDRDGNYVRMVFPYPSGMAQNKISGWGVNFKQDGTYSPKVNASFYRFTWPMYSKNAINAMPDFGPCPIMVPTLDSSKLTIANASTFELLRFNTDGSIDPIAANQVKGRITENPRIVFDIGSPRKVMGPIFITYTKDKSHFYLSGFCRIDTAFWTEGNIWKVDTATRTPVKWFSLGTVSTNSGAGGNKSYTAVHGTAIDDSGHVFVCNRYNNQVMILDSNATVIRTISLMYPDAITYDSETGALYVASRYGYFGSPGNIKLYRIDNWRTDNAPSITIPICDVKVATLGRDRTYLIINGTGTSKRIWIAFKDIGAIVFKENGANLEVVKDFYNSGKKQRFLGFQRMAVDPKTEAVFIASGSGDFFKLTNWDNPVYEKCSLDVASATHSNWAYGIGTRQIVTSDFGIDAKNRSLVVALLMPSSDNEVVFKLDLDNHYHGFVAAQSGSCRVSDTMQTNEVPGSLYRDRGVWPTPDGGVVAINGWNRNYQNLWLQYHYVDPVTGTPKKIGLDSVGQRASCVRTDLQGNIYIGNSFGKIPDSIPAGFENDEAYKSIMGDIYKYKATGNIDSAGALFTNARIAPEKKYGVGFGKFGADANGIGARFGVDPYGRIYYPNTLAQGVHVMDNEGNEILRFGTYGNIDDWLAIEGQWDKATKVPLSWPNSVDATDDYIYVADFVNTGMVRMKKNFACDNMNGADYGHVNAYIKATNSKQVMLSAAPNPFSSSSTINFVTGMRGVVKIGIFDLAGREIVSHIVTAAGQGHNSFKWNGRHRNGNVVAAGVYLVKMDYEGKRLETRLLKIR